MQILLFSGMSSHFLVYFESCSSKVKPRLCYFPCHACFNITMSSRGERSRYPEPTSEQNSSSGKGSGWRLGVELNAYTFSCMTPATTAFHEPCADHFLLLRQRHHTALCASPRPRGQPGSGCLCRARTEILKTN